MLTWTEMADKPSRLPVQTTYKTIKGQSLLKHLQLHQQV